MNTEIVIRTHDLTRCFGETVAVDHLSLEIYRGEIFGLIGHNGAGKTTTVRLINGVLAPTQGTAEVLGMSPFDNGEAVRQHTGVLTETPALYERLTARDNLRIFADLYDVPREKVNSRVDELLAFFDLEAHAEEKTGGYSKGMKRRLALARAFLHNPELMFLDEPTSGLDPVAANQVNDLIRSISHEEGKTVILATHNLHDAQQMCDRVAVMEHGRLVALGTPMELAQRIVQNVEVEIEIDPEHLHQAKLIAESHPHVVVMRRQQNLMVVTGLSRPEIPQILTALTAAGVRIYRVVPNDPTLEGFYLALHRTEAARNRGT